MHGFGWHIACCTSPHGHNPARTKRVVEALAIDEPFPRSAAFRVSTAFSRHARHLQDSLLHASSASSANADEVSS